MSGSQAHALGLSGLWKIATSRARARAIAAMLVASALSACAQSSTVIDTQVGIDPTVPPLLILQMTVTNVANPALQSSSQEASRNPGVQAGVPGPFAFPLELPISVNTSLAGTVTVTVQGLDWNTPAVIASGSTTAQVVPQQQTHATITLTGTLGCEGTGMDGGWVCEGGADGAEQ